jgi:integrase
MTVAHLNDELVSDLHCPTGGGLHIEVFDTLMKGFYVDVLLNGRMSYRVRYYEDGKKKCATIGNARVISTDEARSIAREILHKVSMGINPKLSMRSGHISSIRKTQNLLSFANFFETKYLPFVKGYKRSWKCDVTLINNHINPALGHLLMVDIMPSDIARVIHGMHLNKYAAGTRNRVLVLIRYAYALSLKWHEAGITYNPAKDLPNLKQDNKLERFLSTEEATRLMSCVRLSDNSMLQSIVPFLIYTGARKREVLDAKWVDIDWQEKSWRIPFTKSGKVRHVPLSKGALEILLKLKDCTKQIEVKRVASPIGEWIFSNPKTLKPYVSIFYSWDTARKLANMPELRIHDLRHSFASFLVNAGRSLYEVQELLGHADIRTTSRYAHLNRERLVGAVACVPLV